MSNSIFNKLWWQAYSQHVHTATSRPEQQQTSLNRLNSKFFLPLCKTDLNFTAQIWYFYSRLNIFSYVIIFYIRYISNTWSGELNENRYGVIFLPHSWPHSLKEHVYPVCSALCFVDADFLCRSLCVFIHLFIYLLISWCLY